jgi:uncharacterized lipoprotein
MRKLIVVLLLAALPVLGGCHLRHSLAVASCEPHAAFRKARSVPSLRAPEGLPPPGTRNALKIPDEVAPVKPRTARQACLDEPPSFYADRPKPAPAK